MDTVDWSWDLDPEGADSKACILNPVNPLSGEGTKVTALTVLGISMFRSLVYCVVGRVQALSLMASGQATKY